MKILVGYGRPDAWELKAVRRNLDVQGIAYEAVDCSGDEHAYVDLLESTWNEGGGFIVVEHDILPWPGALAELEACSEDHCMFPYIQGDRLSGFLGCTKFSAELTQTVAFPTDPVDPNRDPADHPDPAMRLRWLGLDEAIAHVLVPAGFGAHLHLPPVVHLNPRYEAAFGTDLNDHSSIRTMYDLTYA